MATQGIYEEVEIEDMIFSPETAMFHYPCPCGDKFEVSLDDLLDGDDIAHCPSCTLRVRVIFDDDALTKYEALVDALQIGETAPKEAASEALEAPAE